MDINITKDDYKRFKICFKLAFIAKTNFNLELFFKLINEKKIYSKNSFYKNIQNTKLDFDKLFNNKNIDIKNSEQVKNQYLDFHSPSVYYGKKVGNLGKKYFRLLYSQKCLDLSDYALNLNIKKTKSLIKNLNYDIFFEPAFQFNNLNTKCDVLIRDKENPNAFHLIEIKAKNNNYNKKIESNLINDVFYQYYVLTQNNIEIKSIKLMLINNNYWFNDINQKKYDLKNLFILRSEINTLKKSIKNPLNLLEYCQLLENLAQIKKDLKNLKLYFSRYLYQPNSEYLKLITDSKCLNENNKYCKHIFLCQTKLDTIHHLYGSRKIPNFYYDLEVYTLIDLQNHLSDLSKHQLTLSSNQLKQVKFANNDNIIIEPKDLLILNQLISMYKYPIYMYDFETANPALPLFFGTHPYEQVPFQYSCHIILNENNKNIKHCYFLTKDNHNLIINFIKNFINTCFEFGKGVYVVYSESFEKKILDNLIAILKKYLKFFKLTNQQIIEYKNYIQDLLFIKSKTLDLMKLFTNFKIYHHNLNGSLSIKSLLPCFIKDNAYKSLIVQKGDIASELFIRYLEKNINQDLWLLIRSDMIKYCNQDTKSMIDIWFFTNKVVKEKNNNEK